MDIRDERDFFTAQLDSQPTRPFKRTASGNLITASYNTPASDQMYGYVLEAAHA